MRIIHEMFILPIWSMHEPQFSHWYVIVWWTWKYVICIYFRPALHISQSICDFWNVMQTKKNGKNNAEFVVFELKSTKCKIKYGGSLRKSFECSCRLVSSICALWSIASPEGRDFNSSCLKILCILKVLIGRETNSNSIYYKVSSRLDDEKKFMRKTMKILYGSYLHLSYDRPEVWTGS